MRIVKDLSTSVRFVKSQRIKRGRWKTFFFQIFFQFGIRLFCLFANECKIQCHGVVSCFFIFLNALWVLCFDDD
jgi:hypothetical protein